MPKPLLSSRTMAALRRIELRGFTTEDVTVGGDTWSVQRATGDGMSGPVVTGPAAAITGYVYQQRATSERASAPGTPVGEALWLLTVVAGSVQIGDVITSEDDSQWVFTVGPPTSDPLYPTYLLNRGGVTS